MQGALDTLGHMYCSGNRAAILGDMLELGDIAASAHIEVGRHAAQCENVDFYWRVCRADAAGGGPGRSIRFHR